MARTPWDLTQTGSYTPVQGEALGSGNNNQP